MSPLPSRPAPKREPDGPPSLKLTADRVYRVRSERDTTVRVALKPHMVAADLRWHDTLRGRSKRGRLVVNEPGRAVFESFDGARYTFEPLTLPVYDREVRPFLEGQPAFDKEEIMHRFFLERFTP
jgi:hypothetical protein